MVAATELNEVREGRDSESRQPSARTPGTAGSPHGASTKHRLLCAAAALSRPEAGVPRSPLRCRDAAANARSNRNRGGSDRTCRAWRGFPRHSTGSDERIGQHAFAAGQESAMQHREHEALAIDVELARARAHETTENGDESERGSGRRSFASRYRQGRASLCQECRIAVRLAVATPKSSAVPRIEPTSPPFHPPERSSIMDRRNVLGFLSAGAAAGCASLLSGSAPLSAAAQPGHGLAARAASAQDHRHQDDPHRPQSDQAGDRQGFDQRARALRPGLRHVHPASVRRANGRGEVPEAVPDRPQRRRDRGHLAVILRQLVLAERSGAVQRHERRRHGALGHQGQACEYAGLSIARRQVPVRRRVLRARARPRRQGGRGQRARRRWPGAIATSACR